MTQKKENTKQVAKKVVKEKKVIVKKPIVKKEINYDATNLILGRLSSYVAQKLLLGYKINIYNAEKAIITGDPKIIVEQYTVKLNFRGKGNPEKGPKYPRIPDKMLLNAVKRMLPHKKTRGIDAFKDLKVFIGNEDNVKLETIEDAKLQKSIKYLQLGELSTKLGAKW